jgi:hypothetical protein
MAGLPLLENVYRHVIGTEQLISPNRDAHLLAYGHLCPFIVAKLVAKSSSMSSESNKCTNGVTFAPWQVLALFKV